MMRFFTFVYFYIYLDYLFQAVVYTTTVKPVITTTGVFLLFRASEGRGLSQRWKGDIDSP